MASLSPNNASILSQVLLLPPGCVPWPCFQFLGAEDPGICQHYVHAPDDVKVELLDDPDPSSDTAVVSWRPSVYGMLTRVGV